MQGLFWFFLRSDASGIGVAVIHCTHASGMKAHAESNRIRNKHWLFFSQKKLMMEVLPLVFESSKNRPWIVGWMEYSLVLLLSLQLCRVPSFIYLYIYYDYNYALCHHLFVYTYRYDSLNLIVVVCNLFSA